MQRAAADHHGALIRTIVDDKGVRCLIACGVPGNAQRSFTIACTFRPHVINVHSTCAPSSTTRGPSSHAACQVGHLAGISRSMLILATQQCTLKRRSARSNRLQLHISPDRNLAFQPYVFPPLASRATTTPGERYPCNLPLARSRTRNPAIQIRNHARSRLALEPTPQHSNISQNSRVICRRQGSALLITSQVTFIVSQVTLIASQVTFREAVTYK